jgi:hypothetical protein
MEEDRRGRVTRPAQREMIAYGHPRKTPYSPGIHSARRASNSSLWTMVAWPGNP